MSISFVRRRRRVAHASSRLPTVASLTLLSLVTLALVLPRNPPPAQNKPAASEAPGRFWSDHIPTRIKP